MKNLDRRKGQTVVSPPAEPGVYRKLNYRVDFPPRLRAAALDVSFCQAL